jgi:cold shock CspA family protein
MIGKVSFWSNIKGFGFIVGTDQSEDLFCHHSALLEGRCIEKDAMVSYEVGEHRGKRCAKNVKKLVAPGELAKSPAIGESVNAKV